MVGWLFGFLPSGGVRCSPLRGEGVWTHDEGRLPWRYLLPKVRVPGRGVESSWVEVENSWVEVGFSGERGA